MRVSARFVNSACALFIAAAFITSCREREPTSIAAVDPTPRTATAVAPDTRPVAPPPASPPPAPLAAERVLSEIGADADATRVTTARVSFDAGGQSGIVPAEQGEVGGSKLAMQNRAAYGPLYAYFHRMHAAALVEAATTLDHARLLARRDEFESSSAEDSRYKQWQNAVAAVFRTHLIGKDYEVFGLAVPPDAPHYDANRAQWVVPFPLLPSITDILGREYSAAYLADHPDVQDQLRRGLPLMIPNIYTSPLKWELGPADSGAEKAILIPASGDEARALKERLQSGRAFYYLRFNTDVKATFGRDYAERISYTDAALVLRPVSIAIYTVGPDAVLGAFGRVPDVSELWFLGHASLGRGVATPSPSSGGM